MYYDFILRLSKKKEKIPLWITKKEREITKYYEN